MYICSFKIKKVPDGRLIKHKSHLFAHVVMQKWGVDYWETYSSVFHFIHIKAMLILSILRELLTKSIYFVLNYAQADLKSYILMELPIGFGI